MNTYEGLLTVTNEKFCIVISRFNEFIGGKLLSGAKTNLKTAKKTPARTGGGPFKNCEYSHYSKASGCFIKA